MKIVLLAGANSIHTIRWANGLASRDIEVHLVSVLPLEHNLDVNVRFHLLPISPPWGYITSIRSLKKLLIEINPDLMNAHYASGYGLLARLVKFKPLLLSVWGSDIYNFPNKSFLHRWLIRANLRAATAITSASHCMAQETAKIFPNSHVFITPFGVDIKTFFPTEPLDRQNNTLVIGTIKALSSLYGIDTLIIAFAKTCQHFSGQLNLRLEITGKGNDLLSLQALAAQYNVTDKITFHGFVNHHKVPEMLSRLDIYVALSRQESFGVAVLEACACAKPVVVSDAEGLTEVIVDGVTGLIVPREDANAAAQALVKLIESPHLREQLGKQGRAYVLEHYSWEKSVDIMLTTYKTTLDIHTSSQQYS